MNARIYSKRLLGGLILSLCLFHGQLSSAQEKYNVVLEQVQTLSPYEAIYVLMDYQTWHPDYPSIYYHLGNLTYDLLPTRDPLHHYTELNSLLYRARLFYGNCLHFAKDQKLTGWQFEPLAQGQKRIEYPVLEQYIRPRMEEVKKQQTACDSIHNTFVRMVERYNRCQALYTDFLNRYTREKTAHLQLQPEEQQLLKNLQWAADSLDQDIQAFRTALALHKIEGYDPQFRKEPILLYRLDGLTYTDFLQNDIATWDYSAWVRQFQTEHANVYERLYRDLAQEHKQLTNQLQRYAIGQTVSGQMDGSLVGRCARLELQSPQVDSVRMMQEQVRNCIAQQTIAQSPAPQTIRELVPLLQIAAGRRDATEDEALRTMKTMLIEMAKPLRIQQQPVYTHPVTGETISYQPAANETVHGLLPDDTGYRCVVTDGTAIQVLSLYHDRSLRSEMLRITDEQPLVFTKIPGNVWALLTDKNIYWL